MSEPNENQNAGGGCPPATGSAFQPRDQQWLQEICELVKNKMPDSHNFVVFAFPHSATDRCYYASNAERASIIAALKEWIAYQEKVENWMKHDDGPPPSPLQSPIAMAVANYADNIIRHRERDISNTTNEQVAKHSGLQGQITALKNVKAYLKELGFLPNND